MIYKSNGSQPGDPGWDDEVREAVNRLVALRSSQSTSDAGGGVRVKPLRWEMQNIDGTIWCTEISVCGEYRVSHGHNQWNAMLRTAVIGRFDTCDEAKAAAQSDYERRVLSALSNPAAADSNASAEARLRGAFSRYLDAQVAKTSELQRNAYVGGNDRKGEKYHAIHCALYEVKMEFEALSPDPHASDCERFKHFAPDGELGKPKKAFDETVIKEAFFLNASDCEKQGETGKAEFITGYFTDQYKAGAKPPVGPSERPADVTTDEIASIIEGYQNLIRGPELAAIAIHNAFTVGRR